MSTSGSDYMGGSSGSKKKVEKSVLRDNNGKVTKNIA
jgi:hypothetical protein